MTQRHLDQETEPKADEPEAVLDQNDECECVR